MNSIADTLRASIRNSGLSYRQIGLQAGVNRQSVQRFADGHTSITLEQAEALARFFNLELTPTKKEG